jgi:4a-hydroxytetrahydrobiopterin dehydratase
MALLKQEQIDNEVKNLQGWQVHGKEIRKEFELKDFVHSMGFVTSVGLLAEKADHHPDIDIRWNKVRLVLSTHSEGGLTAKDIELAKQIDALGEG